MPSFSLHDGRSCLGGVLTSMTGWIFQLFCWKHDSQKHFTVSSCFYMYQTSNQSKVPHWIIQVAICHQAISYFDYPFLILKWESATKARSHTWSHAAIMNFWGWRSAASPSVPLWLFTCSWVSQYWLLLVLCALLMLRLLLLLFTVRPSFLRPWGSSHF